MDDHGSRENGRHKPDQYRSVHHQWMIPPHQMKDHHTAQTIKLMAIMAERDSALNERDLTLSEKKTAQAERDMAIFQRDAAIAERNNTIIERDNAITALPPHQMKDHHTAQTIKLMAIMAQRDSALNERDLALSEKKTAQAERDMAIFQRDAAIAERNKAIIECDNAITALEYSRENSINSNGARRCSPGRNTPHRARNMNNLHYHHAPSSLDLSDYTYNNHEREMHTSEALPTSAHSEGVGKASQERRPRKEPKSEGIPSQKASKSQRKSRRGNGGGGEDLNRQVTIAEMHGEWRGQDITGEDSLKSQVPMSKKHRKEWKVEELGGLNEVMFDDASMPVPVCSCTGRYQPCYKWGNGGWQSACCTTTLSMYPLPVMPNKRHARVNGRKMSGAVFTKLLSRLASEGHDLRVPVDLKDHWSKHGTNRYITIK